MSKSKNTATIPKIVIPQAQTERTPIIGLKLGNRYGGENGKELFLKEQAEAKAISENRIGANDNSVSNNKKLAQELPEPQNPFASTLLEFDVPSADIIRLLEIQHEAEEQIKIAQLGLILRKDEIIKYIVRNDKDFKGNIRDYNVSLSMDNRSLFLVKKS